MWLRDLSDLTTMQIHRGLDSVRKDGEKFPPSLPYFRKVCLGDDDDESYYPPEVLAALRQAERETLADKMAQKAKEIGHG